MSNTEFKYFRNPMEHAEFTDEECELCGAHEECLAGVYFDSEDELDSVCLKCLSEGKQLVEIPEFVEDRLRQNIREYKNIKDEKELNKEVGIRMDELRRTPPVPWIQYNDWPVCCGDFCEYIGEWDQEDINRHAPDGNGKAYLLSILDDFSRGRVDDVDALWDEIGDMAAIFVFKCLECSKIIAVCQSY